MEVTCPECRSRFRLPENVPPQARLRCSLCGRIFTLEQAWKGMEGNPVDAGAAAGDGDASNQMKAAAVPATDLALDATHSQGSFARGEDLQAAQEDQASSCASCETVRGFEEDVRKEAGGLSASSETSASSDLHHVDAGRSVESQGAPSREGEGESASGVHENLSEEPSGDVLAQKSACDENVMEERGDAAENPSWNAQEVLPEDTPLEEARLGDVHLGEANLEDMHMEEEQGEARETCEAPLAGMHRESDRAFAGLHDVLVRDGDGNTSIPDVASEKSCDGVLEAGSSALEDATSHPVGAPSAPADASPLAEGAVAAEGGTAQGLREGESLSLLSGADGPAIPEATVEKKEGRGGKGTLFLILFCVLLASAGLYGWKLFGSTEAKDDANVSQQASSPSSAVPAPAPAVPSSDKTEAAPAPASVQPAASEAQPPVHADPAAASTPAPSSPRLSLVDVKQGNVNNSFIGNIMVIWGAVKNDSKEPRGRVRLSAALMDAEKRILVGPTEYVCGVSLTTAQLQSMTQQAIVAALENLDNASMPGGVVAPGDRIPFCVVFFNPTRDVREFALRLCGSEPAPSSEVKPSAVPMTGTSAQ